MTFFVAQAAINLPNFGLTVTSQRGGPIQILRGPAGAAYPASLISIAPAADPGASTALDARHDVVRRGEADLVAAAIPVQDRLLTLARQGAVTVEMRDASGAHRQITVTPHASSLNSQFLILIFTGLLGAFVGLWAIVLQPSRLAAWAVGVSGIGLTIAAYPVGLILNGEMIIGGARWVALMQTNYAGAQLFGSALIVLFARYPRPLLSAPVTLALSLASAVYTAAALFATSLPNETLNWFNALLLVDLALIAGLASAQWFANRTDPVGRGWLKLVGATSVLSLGTWAGVTIGPQMMGEEPLLDVATGFLLMLPPYIAIALGIVRGHMFDVDRWAGRLFVSAATLLTIVIVEAALVAAVGVASGPATSIAFLLVGCAWLLTRHRLLDRLLGRNDRRLLWLMQEAHAVVLAPTPDERARRWWQCLDRTFQPLESKYIDGIVPETVVSEAGLELHIAAPSFGLPLVLRSARGGRALFGGEDVAIAEQFRTLCDRIEKDRLAYDRGARSERERIAQDLHDDVSGRLLTGLHRVDPDQVRADVRAALRDIRSIVSGLEGQLLPLDAVVADLRCESAERLEAAGMTLDWPVALPETELVLDYAAYRALGSITREIVTNAIRHSRGARVTIRMRLDPGSILVMEAQDDGIGFDGDGEGRGLRNITARTRERGGSARFERCAGSRIVIRLPLLSPETGAGARTTEQTQFEQLDPAIL